MTWRYQMVRKTVELQDGETEYIYGIHEVFYNKDGEVWGMTEEPVSVMGDTPRETVATLGHMALDLDDGRAEVLELPMEFARPDWDKEIKGEMCDV